MRSSTARSFRMRSQKFSERPARSSLGRKCTRSSSPGGTGMTPRDVTPEALEPLFDKAIPGFGELFRMLSLKEIGTAMMQSRACAGLAGGKVVWALPGSTGACSLALQEILLPQLDSRTKPCSVSSLLFC